MTGDRAHFGPLHGKTIQGVTIHSPRSLAEELLWDRLRSGGSPARIPDTYLLKELDLDGYDSETLVDTLLRPTGALPD